ncbi:UNKNOWN [Stylonychia lemnae]|uniref:Uncharacterized protein n=1 Tax=Stylonychia lemnae TaxID=5949 RepID=A0A077ZZF0_STYLE|nr:UNKNOWN [Stylonychia lemnae]|eukprot:CDW75300.1 UNKNOWN [Stylonychia lemnae]
MNLAQIEKKFHQLEVKENYMRYFYNPQCRKILGLKQHAYIEELQKDYDQDVKTFGMDPFVYTEAAPTQAQTKAVNESVITKQSPQKNGVISHDFDEEYQSQVLNSALKHEQQDNQGEENIQRTSTYDQAEGDEDEYQQFQSKRQSVGNNNGIKNLEGMTINQRRRLLSSIKISKFYNNRPKTSSQNAKRKQQSYDGLFSKEGKNLIDQCIPTKLVLQQYQIQEARKKQQVMSLTEDQHQQQQQYPQSPPQTYYGQSFNINVNDQHQFIQPSNQNDNQLIMQLYKIKSNSFYIYLIFLVLVPQQILAILRNYISGNIKTTMPTTPVQERKLSPRFSKVGSQTKNQFSNYEIRSNATQLIPSEEFQETKLVEQSPVIGRESQIIINGQKQESMQAIPVHTQKAQQLQQQNLQEGNIEPILLSKTILRDQLDQLAFNIKLTDLSDVENPFVIYENKRIDQEGYIIFDNLDWNVLNPIRMFPWLSHAKDLEKRTLKIEVTFQSELVLLRFIHLDKFYQMKFPQIMLEITNNMIQNQNLISKQQKQQQLQAAQQNIAQQSNDDLIDLGSQDRKEDEDGILILKRIEQHKLSGQQLLQNEKVKNSIDSHEGFKGVALTSSSGNIPNLHEHYYCLKPMKNEALKLILDLKNYRVNIRNIYDELMSRKIEITPPQLKQLRIIIEYTDCIIQAKDLLQYEILMNDNKRQNIVQDGQNNNNGDEQGLAQNGNTRISDLLQNKSRPYSQGRVIQQRGNQQGFNPILMGKRLSNSNQTIFTSTQYTRHATLNPNLQGRQDPEDTIKNLMAKYGQNRSVQFYVRKELDAQLAENRKNYHDKPRSAAINMRDNRKIYHHMNQNVLYTKPIQLNSSLTNYNQTTASGMSKFQFEVNASLAQKKHRQLINEMQKGEIELERFTRDIDDQVVTHGQNNQGDIPDFFQSVKSSSMGGFGNVQGLFDEPKEYMNFPYSRAQDVLGASLATPPQFFKGNTLSGTGAIMSGGLMTRKANRDIFYQKKDSTYKQRPSTQGRIIFGNAGSLLGQNQVRKSGQFNDGSLAYFDQGKQVFGIKGKSNFS